MTEQNQRQFNPKSEYELKREKKLAEQEQTLRKQTIKRISKIAAIIAAAGGAIGILVWFIVSRPQIPASEIIARGGMHWHSQLTIYVKGVKQEIPADIGIGAIPQPIHTHEDSDQGVIHMEFQGFVQKKDIALGQFFKNWGKDIRSFGTNMKMVVNGAENAEYENYAMRDNDKIELRYE